MILILNLISSLFVFYFKLSIGDCDEHVVLDRDVLNQFLPIRYVDLSFKSIHEIKIDTFQFKNVIEELNLAGNKMSNLHDASFANLSSLKRLNLSLNRIYYLSSNVFQNTPNLSSIDLAHNQLEQLMPELFRGLTHLRRLSLSFNKIKFLSRDLFLECELLHIICLDNNELIHLNQNFLTHFDIHGIKHIFVNLKFNNIKSLQRGFMNKLHKLKHIDFLFEGNICLISRFNEAAQYKNVNCTVYPTAVTFSMSKTIATSTTTTTTTRKTSIRTTIVRTTRPPKNQTLLKTTTLFKLAKTSKIDTTITKVPKTTKFFGRLNKEALFNSTMLSFHRSITSVEYYTNQQATVTDLNDYEMPDNAFIISIVLHSIFIIGYMWAFKNKLYRTNNN